MCVSVNVYTYAQAHTEPLKASKSQSIGSMEHQGSPSGPFGFSCLKLLLRQIILAVSEQSSILVLQISSLCGFSQVNPACHWSTVNDVLLRDLQLCIIGLKSFPAFFTLLLNSFCHTQESLSILKRSA